MRSLGDPGFRATFEAVAAYARRLAELHLTDREVELLGAGSDPLRARLAAVRRCWRVLACLRWGTYSLLPKAKCRTPRPSVEHDNPETDREEKTWK